MGDSDRAVEMFKEGLTKFGFHFLDVFPDIIKSFPEGSLPFNTPENLLAMEDFFLMTADRPDNLEFKRGFLWARIVDLLGTREQDDEMLKISGIIDILMALDAVGINWRNGEPK